MLKCVFAHVSAAMAPPVRQRLTHFQEMAVALVKLRLNPPLYDLARRMGVTTSTISRILLKWFTAMNIRLQHLIHWPEREELQKTMPVCFQESFGKKVVVIIDCFEVFIDRPSNLMARAQTWSNYKHHNTIKLLLGTTPQGVVSFISKAWGGRASDKYITEHCGILQHLLPGDIVLADRGFDIEESVALNGGKLHIPAFTRGKLQLSAEDVHETRTIANVRIHVERVIGHVRQKYTILKGALPLDYMNKRAGEDVPLIDRIVPLCCSLSNLSDSVVPFD